MDDRYTRLRVLQTGGFAGSSLIVDLDRAVLDAAGAATLDQACQLLEEAGAAPTVAVEIGADIPGYSIELEGDGASRRFTVVATDAAGANVRSILAALGKAAHVRT